MASEDFADVRLSTPGGISYKRVHGYPTYEEDMTTAHGEDEWIITTAEGEVERVKGPGVVGEQPVLQPGASFEYTSYCPLKTAVGSMHGSYQMVTAGGERFDALIAPFTLAVPNSLN